MAHHSPGRGCGRPYVLHEPGCPSSGYEIYFKIKEKKRKREARKRGFQEKGETQQSFSNERFSDGRPFEKIKMPLKCP